MSYNTPPSEPVAVVGSSCRFAGGVSSPSKLWALLKNPSDLSREVPANRFSIDGFFHEDGEHHGTTNSSKGYWLDNDHRVFDTSFFNITPKEAEAIDPQQRMLLEAVYESLESAGYTMQQYSGQNVAVFAGIMTADYDTLSQRDDITASQYYATGNARSIISNRLSYFYNFHGPSMTIDTACSSSLVALHQAVLSLRSGESVMACVTGANLMLTPEQFIVESSLHMLSPTGHCRMWDQDADGYARGEGVAALLLKPLSRALADGDNIQAIIRETGVNSDGRTKGITMPNPQAQAALIRDTYGRTGLDPCNEEHRCQYFEAHGTGTHAGDPREAAAISEAFFGAPEEQQQPREHGHDAPDWSAKLLVGSVKTVIGHTEGAAGLAGVLKVIQAMRHEQVPPNLHLHTLNPSVQPFYGNLHIPTKMTAWPLPKTGHPLRASVNSFGFGGTNSHAIVERYTPTIHDPVGRHFLSGRLTSPRRVVRPNRQVGAPCAGGIKLPLVLSANSQKSLLAAVGDYRDFLAGLQDPAEFDQVLWNLYANRTAFPFRLAVPGGPHENIIRALSTLVSLAPTASAELGTRAGPSKGEAPKILGIFTGQGAQWATMSRGLLLSCTSFQRSIEALDDVLQSCAEPPDWTLRQQILAGPHDSRVNVAAISQPLSTALQIALVDLLSDLGVSFHSVVGHSSGEIAAAYAAGRLTARDAILVAYFRGLYAHLAGGHDGAKGGMVAVGLSRVQAQRLCDLAEFRGRVCLAASNSSSSTTLSGDLGAVHEVQRCLAEQGKFSRVLLVDTAYHSHHMTPAADKYVTALKSCGITPLPERKGTRWFSSVYEDARYNLGSDELVSAYWVANMRSPVLFREALEEAVKTAGPFDVALEVGPHPQLKGPAIQTIKSVTDSVPLYSGLLDRKKDDAVAFSEFVGLMWKHFGPSAIRLGAAAPESTTSTSVTAITTKDSPESILERMPRYSWDHSQVHYRESRVSRQYHFRTHAPHELLGVRTRDDTEFELRWRNILKLESVPWIEHHRFQGQALLPASAYCVMALDAARVLLNGRAASVVELEDLEFMNGITIEPGSYGVEVLSTLTVLPPPKERRRQSVVEASFSLTSAYADGSSPMRKNFQGNMRIVLGEPCAQALPVRPAQHAETMSVGSEAFYQMMKGLDLDYTGPFRGIRTIERRLDFASTTLLKVHPDDTTTLNVSPAMLDTCFQSCFSAFSSAGDKALWTSFLPRSVSKMRFNLACDKKVPDQEVVVDAYLTDFRPMSREGASTISGDIAIYNDSGEMEVQVEGMMIASFAATKPENDYELYLHTVMQVDPEDEIISMTVEEDAAAHRNLVESCERVASFYKTTGTILSSLAPPSTTRMHHSTSAVAIQAWPDETEESLKQFISSSRYSGSLEFLSSLGKNLPDVLPAMMPGVIHEAGEQFRFQVHLSNIVRQIAHRYPRMNVLGVTDQEMGLDEHILSGLQSSFSSYTIASDSKTADRVVETKMDLKARIREKILIGNDRHILVGDEREDDTESNSSSQSHDVSSATSYQDTNNYDLVVLSTSVLSQHKSSAALRRVRGLMKPGGFLVLVHVSASPLRDRLRRCAGDYPPSGSAFPLTPPDWPDILDECGFIRGPRNSDQYYPPGFSVTIRQTECAEKGIIRHPLGADAAVVGGTPLLQPKVTRKLLIVGGGVCARTATLAVDLKTLLGPVCDECATTDFLETAEPNAIASCSAAVILSDLDQPTLSTMTADRLEAFRSLLRPDMVVLWVTHRARDHNPEHAASFGFARTLVAEIPSLTLQMLDLDEIPETGTLDGVSRRVAETFARLAFKNAAQEQHIKEGALLWSHEPEIHVDDTGRRLVPRVLPYRPGIDRVNAVRRMVSRTINTVETCVEITPAQSTDGSTHYSTKVGILNPGVDVPGQTTVQVHYSSVDVLNLGYNCSSHVCVGRDLGSGRAVVALSPSNASFVQVPALLVHELADDSPTNSAVVDSIDFAGLLLRFLTALSILERAATHRRVLLVEPDELLFECAQQVFTRPLPWLTPTQMSSHVPVLSACTSDVSTHRRHPNWTFVHPCSAPRTLKALFSTGGAGDTAVFDFMSDAPEMSEMILDCLPEDSEYHSSFSLLSSAGQPAAPVGEEAMGNDALLSRAVQLATTQALISLDKDEGPEPGASKISESVVSVPALLQGSHPPTSFQVIDWRAERSVAHATKHLVGTNMLRPYKTYVLVGITRDLGQSLCRLFIEQGARHIVLASRNPDLNPRWKTELESSVAGVEIRIEKMDVTDLEDVNRFRDRIAETMPPVAGIVNGAMVLEDRVFAQMSLETLHRVMRPKTAGSANLDRAFEACGADMEFFIMTSSFAAVGGHAGQSNYAAANMYMNGLAADRRRRGLAASVLNIGVIYGLGFLHREKDNLYKGLEREGYPPVSERDIHHMFLEAIAAGKATGGSDDPHQILDLTTGLSRYRVDDPNPLHWHRDPRFSHYTVDEEDEGPGDEGKSSQSSVRERLAQAGSEAEVRAVVAAEVAAKLQALLQLHSDVPLDASISDLGVDSLMAVEIRAWIYKAVGKDVPVMKILGSPSIAKLCADIAALIMADRQAVATTVSATGPTEAKTLSGLQTPGGSATSEERVAASKTDSLVQSVVSSPESEQKHVEK